MPPHPSAHRQRQAAWLESYRHALLAGDEQRLDAARRRLKQLGLYLTREPQPPRYREAGPEAKLIAPRPSPAFLGPPR